MASRRRRPRDITETVNLGNDGPKPSRSATASSAAGGVTQPAAQQQGKRRRRDDGPRPASEAASAAGVAPSADEDLHEDVCELTWRLEEEDRAEGIQSGAEEEDEEEAVAGGRAAKADQAGEEAEPIQDEQAWMTYGRTWLHCAYFESRTVRQQEAMLRRLSADHFKADSHGWGPLGCPRDLPRLDVCAWLAAAPFTVPERLEEPLSTDVVTCERPPLPPGVRDIDAPLARPTDPLMVAQYSPFIYQRFRELERQRRVVPLSIRQRQPEINPLMRAILVGWLVEVGEEYRLMPETLYMTVNIVDRYLAAHSVSRHNLQLLGCGAMLLSCKYEEISPVTPRELVFISDKTYTQEQIKAMESKILAALDFDVRCATVKTFMLRFVRAAGARRGDKLSALVKFLGELSLPEMHFLKYLPSRIAAAAILVARKSLGFTAWSRTLTYYTGYSEDALQECATDIIYAHADACEAKGVIWSKYSHAPYHRVAKSVVPIDPPAGHERSWTSQTATTAGSNTY